jgi:dTDP-4-dehydrorhamnose 3,5-epimerase
VDRLSKEATPCVVEPLAVEGAALLTPNTHADERGWFRRTFDAAWCDTVGCPTDMAHHNQSRSARGVLRGMHVRTGASEHKLVRCAHGTVVDVVLDVRPWSPTFGKTATVHLDDELGAVLYLPPHVAHGFQVLSETADVCYLHSRPYVAGDDVAICATDPALGIKWPIAPASMSPRDANAPLLASVDLASLLTRHR